jgi:hypothetical protein
MKRVRLPFSLSERFKNELGFMPDITLINRL